MPDRFAFGDDCGRQSHRQICRHDGEMDKPLKNRQPATPTTPIKTPASAGPNTRAPLNSDEFNAIAFIKSSLPTISTTKLCRVGMSERVGDALQQRQHAILPKPSPTPK